MSWAGWLVWGFTSTVVLSTIFALTQGLGMTRMSIPYLLGSMVTRDRDRARLVGIALHLAMGWIFALLYTIGFEVCGAATWWRGALFGLLHALFLLGVLMPALPAMHPSMASERRGPTVVRQLEPPGFFGLNYGVQTPITVVIAHIVFGVILGALYRT
jgi:uncharacterized membrane protein YagU involved in acid resistance